MGGSPKEAATLAGTPGPDCKQIGGHLYCRKHWKCDVHVGCKQEAERAAIPVGQMWSWGAWVKQVGWGKVDGLYLRLIWLYHPNEQSLCGVNDIDGWDTDMDTSRVCVGWEADLLPSLVVVLRTKNHIREDDFERWARDMDRGFWGRHKMQFTGFEVWTT